MTLTSVLVGCGAIAREHLAALSESKNVTVAALCDISPARARSTADRFGISNWYTDVEQMLAQTKPDLVHITTPPSSHFQLAKTCLSAGFNVLCEKPITMDYKDFIVLKRIAGANDCMLVENQNLRFHSSVRRIQHLIESGTLGDVLDVQILLLLNLGGAGSPYVDENVPHPARVLRGGVIGDFLPHIAYLTHLFAGDASELRTIWRKQSPTSPLAHDEFRALIKGQRATAFVEFSGNAQPNGFFVRVFGTRLCVEANLFEPPRLSFRRYRSGEPALMSLIDGISEGKDIFKGAISGFFRKLAGTSSYDGLPELIAEIYRCLETGAPQPISLDDIQESVRLVERFTDMDTVL